MQPSHLDELVELEDNYWWHRAKRQLAVRLLRQHFPPPGRLVEGGIGSSRNLLAFREMGYEVSGFDVMPAAVELAHERGLHDVRLHDLADPWPIEPDSIRAVVLLDVLEHVGDPVAVLSHVRETLQPGGGVVVTVPAYQWLYSDWDQALGHYRRYTRGLLRSQAEQAGFQVLKLTHWNAFTLPAAVAVRSYSRLFPSNRSADFPRVSPTTNRLLQVCAGVERWAMQRCPIPCGLSVVGVLGR